MEFDRRRLMRAGIAGAGGLMLSSPLLARRQDAMQFREIAPPSIPGTPAPQGVNPGLVERARAALDRHATRVKHRDAVGIVEAQADVCSRRSIPFVDCFYPLSEHDQWISELSASRDGRVL